MGWYSAVIMVWGPCSCDPMLKKWVVVLVGKEGMLTSLLCDVSLILLSNCKIGVF